MSRRIIVCGLNGAGKSTLGRLLAASLGCVWRDIEHYYFPPTDGDYAYAHARTETEVAVLLARDLQSHDALVLSSVRGDYSHEVEALLDAAVFLHVPREERMRRVRDRSWRKFGPRMQPGGDLYEQEEGFFRLISQRTEDRITAWLERTGLPVIHADGTLPPEESLQYILTALRDTQA